MDNLPEVPRNNRNNYAKGLGDDFTSYFMEAMGNLRDSLKLDKNENANVNLTNIKGSLDRGELRKLQELNNTKDDNRKESSEIKAKRTVEVRAQLEYVGIIEDNSMDTKFQKIKETFNRG